MQGAITTEWAACSHGVNGDGRFLWERANFDPRPPKMKLETPGPINKKLARFIMLQISVPVLNLLKIVPARRQMQKLNYPLQLSTCTLKYFYYVPNVALKQTVGFLDT